MVTNHQTFYVTPSCLKELPPCPLKGELETFTLLRDQMFVVDVMVTNHQTFYVTPSWLKELLLFSISTLAYYLIS
jgi:hypothetical protein